MVVEYYLDLMEKYGVTTFDKLSKNWKFGRNWSVFVIGN